ncbi:MAG: hypothetical protein AAF569_02380 [Pseudomonadota bacterium]
MEEGRVRVGIRHNEIEEHSLCFTSQIKQQEFEIRRDSELGYYLYVFDKTGLCTHDYLIMDLENGIEICKNMAQDDFGVSKENWIKYDARP